MKNILGRIISALALSALASPAYTQPYISTIEPLEGEPQFNHPSIAPKEREIFKTEYIGNQNYNAAADKAFEKIKVQSMKEGIVDFRAMRIKVSLWVSPEKKRKLKKILKLIKH